MKMPASVQAYFNADSGHDADALAAAFAQEGVVLDEGGQHQGRDAIRKWWVAAKEASHHVTQPVSSTAQGDRALVHARVSGDFPGSPIMLQFDFTTAHDRIIRLEIK